tara:strand:+ start:60 stop:1355 length:1296 start_codon:yes stop_codon:yes gene_type:complete
MVQELVQTGNPYVYLRRKTYYFRVVIPPHLRELCPSLPREIKRSLRTDSLTDALAMVGDKLPLIRLLRSCSSSDLMLKLYNKLSDFSTEIFGWFKSKLNANLEPIIPPTALIKRTKGLKLDKAWSDFSEWRSWTDKQGKANQRMYDNLRVFLGDITVEEVTKAKLKAALQSISGLPQRNKKHYKQLLLIELKEMDIPEEDKVSSKYVREHLKLFQSLFNTYLKQEIEILKVSPTEGIKWEYENNRFGSLTDTEVNQVMLDMEDKPEWFKWFVLIAVYSGARRSEIAGLTKNDIKFCSDTHRYYFIVRVGKTKAARRAVPIHEKVIGLGLLTWIEAGDDRLFETAYRNLNRVTDLFSSLMPRKENDFGERLVFHSLRHTFITKARAAGVSVLLVQQVVGHEKRGAGQTDRYTHTFQLKDVLKVIDCVDYGVA